MTIANGYCTLAELKERLLDMWTYTASTISFSATSKTISDTAYGLKRFEVSDNVNALIKVSGVTTNAGVYTVTSATPSAVIVSESMSTMAAGTAVTIQKFGIDFADPIMEQIINATSRAIDKYCKRRFYSATQTRYFNANCYDAVFIDDLTTATTVKTDQDGDGTFETTWASGDYKLWPFNALTDGEPYMEIRISSNGTYYFPTSVEKGVEIAGSWGYCTIDNLPPAVKEACLIMAARLYKRKDAPFGITGPNEFGQQTIVDKFDSDVKMLLTPFKRLV